GGHLAAGRDCRAGKACLHLGVVAFRWRYFAKDQSFNGGSLSHRKRCTVSPGPTPRLRISSLSFSVVPGCHRRKVRPAGIAPPNRKNLPSRPLLIIRSLK